MTRALVAAGILATAALAAPPARGEAVFLSDAAGIGSGISGARGSISIGSERLPFSEGPGLEFLAEGAWGLAPMTQVGAWVAQAWAGTICVDGIGFGACYAIDPRGLGLTIRQGLARPLQDRVQVGIEVGVGLIQVPSYPDELGLRLDAAVLASAKLGGLGLAYARAEYSVIPVYGQKSYGPVVETSWHLYDLHVPHATAGLELLQRELHPYVEVTIGWERAVAWWPTAHAERELSLTAGLSFTWR